jgi:hypothetical protein
MPKGLLALSPESTEVTMPSTVFSLWVSIGMLFLCVQPRQLPGPRTAPAALVFEKRLLDASEIGALVPTFGDFDGDGKIDLLVGVAGLGKHGVLEDKSGEGSLLVYLNRGTNAAPVYDKPFWLHSVVPSGRIPHG